MLQSFDLLDLTITLTPPPENAPADTLASMTVCCDALGLNHAAGLLTDPLTPKERADLRWYLEEYSQWPYTEFAVRGKRIEAQLSEIGKRLYQTAFGAVMGQVQPWRLLPTKQRQISIVSTVPAALSLPWELLHDEQGFLVLRTRQPVALLRRLEQHELSELPMAFNPPLRVLVVTARPSGTGFLDPRNLPRELLDALQPQIDTGAVEVEFLRPPTRAALRQRLAQTRRPVHLLHFDGHGVFAGQIDPYDTERKQGGAQGMLAFEDAEGKLDLVKAEDLAQLLQDSGVKLVVLDACQSAMSSDDDAFSSVAARLIQGGIDAAVAMSASVLVVTSTRFFARFYRELAAGTSVPIAQERARQDLYDDPRRHLFRGRADDEGQPVELRDWWLPHFYQQRPLTLRATRAPRKRKSPSGTTLPRFNDDMPKEPRYRFGGRARELLQIERHLLKKRLVVLSGFGGVGKTALAREAADWLTRTGMYACACFVSFEHGGDASLLLSILGTFLGVNDGNYTPENPDAALAQLQPALSARPTLLIADNLESLLPTGDAPLERAARSELWHVSRKLANLEAGVLLTSRAPLAGEDQLASSVHVADLPLGGLTSYDAYALATRLLEDLGIDRTRALYAELRDLLAQLDHHPLAIQLVLPILREHLLDTIRTEFAALLAIFTDDMATGRNRSLLASLEYSLQRLTQEQHVILRRLACFEGGASEEDLLVITQIPEMEWAALRATLTEAALLVPEPVTGVATPFLRFHPLLIPYLRSLLNEEDATLHERYSEFYAKLARAFYQLDRRYPQAIRALFVKELPNIRHALALLLSQGHLEMATDLVNSIARFLSLFGHWRERDELRQQVAVALATQLPITDADAFTYTEFVQESDLGEDELEHGNLHAAAARFTRLLTRIVGQPAGSPLGPNTYVHSVTLSRLARCLKNPDQLAAAESYLRQALTIIDSLLQQEPERTDGQRQRAVSLTELADIMRRKAKYSQARELYTQAWEAAREMNDYHGQAVIEGQLGVLALDQLDLVEAQKHFLVALHAFQALGELQAEAAQWHNLGAVATQQKNWIEGERCCRESLTIQERLGNAVAAAADYLQLAAAAEESGRPDEAEGWLRRMLERTEQTHSEYYALALHNLATLLVKEVGAKRATPSHLIEAKGYVVQALSLNETHNAYEEIWKNTALLAIIADLEGQTEEAQNYRRRSRENFAAFAGNRYLINRQFESRIALIVAAAQGDRVAQQTIEAELPRLEAAKWQITAAVHRIWAGERNWHMLTENLNNYSALLVLLVLEALSASPDTTEVPPA